MGALEESSTKMWHGKHEQNTSQHQLEVVRDHEIKLNHRFSLFETKVFQIVTWQSPINFRTVNLSICAEIHKVKFEFSHTGF